MSVRAVFAVRQFQGLIGVVAVLLVVLLWAIFLDPHFHFSIGVYIPLHTGMHVFSLVVSWLVFAIGWNTYDPRRSGSVIILACGFLGVAIADFGHALSYKGMPDMVTPASPEKAIIFSFVSRALSAVALLVLAFTAWRPFQRQYTRHLFLIATLLLLVMLYVTVLFFPHGLPRTFIDGEGLTPLKVRMEYGLAGLHALAAGGFWVKLRQTYNTQAAFLFCASIAMAMSQALIAFYADPYDLHNFLSHAFRVVGYVMIYRGIFISEVREPYQRAERLQLELGHSTLRLREMGVRMQNDIEQERKRIAQALHDEMGQNLTALRMDADWVQRHCPEDTVVLEAVERMHKGIEESAAAMRRVVADLRPRVLDDLGIVAAAKTLTQDVATRTNLGLAFRCEGNMEDLGEELQTALYRMLQETLTNVVRHAHATRVDVHLRREGKVVALSVADDGIGFDPEARVPQGSFGLFGLSERAMQLNGGVSVMSGTDRGTRIDVWLPVGIA